MDPIATAVQRQRDFFASGATRPLEFRRRQLDRLSESLKRHEPALLAALEADLGKSPFQAYASELGLVHAEIGHARRRLARWAAPARRPAPWLVWPARAWVQREPFGVALIIGPWNYPAALVLTPLVSALAAGNCTLLKPSELAPRTAEALAALIREAFEEPYAHVITGDAEVARRLLAERFDTIFFTGSTRVGRLVMAAAAKHLTPVTLELGGKCPAIVCADAAVASAARRIAWGKFLNAGQTCIAPDFVLVQRRLRDALVASLKQAIVAFYGEDPRRSPDYGRIVNESHLERLAGFVRDGKIAHGGTHAARERYFEPTVLVGVPSDAPVMQEEIFGPVLPVIDFDDLDQALALCRSRPAPLAVYIFTGDRTIERRVLEVIRSGGACVNDVVSHSLGPRLPFGGLGESGLGAYHGRAGFEAFSHARTVLRRPRRLDSSLRYPPPKLPLGALRRLMGMLLGR